MASTSKMRTLLEALVTIMESAITAGTIDASKVFLGLQNAPAQAADTEYPYIMIDEGGEITDIENPNSTNAQNRIYRVVFEMGTYSLENIKEAMLDVLDLTQQVKEVIEDNQQPIGTDEVDGIVWGITITPFGWEDESSFFRGRQVIVEYTLLEDTPEQY
jgi:hypothetical protein